MNENVPLGIREWSVWKQVSEHCYLMYKHEESRMLFAPLYIHSFSFVIPKNSANVRKFMEQYPNPKKMKHPSAKIRYFRYQKELRQQDLADYVGLSREAIVYYESEERDYYEVEVLEKFAELLEVDILDLLDDYNLFLYQGQAARLKNFRKENQLTQRQLAKYLDVDITKIKGWEQSRVRMTKPTYHKFLAFEKSFNKSKTMIADK